MTLIVYFLQSGSKSYIGFTVDIYRRVRQHRGELVGGAKATRAWADPNLEVVAYISNFPTKHLALSYEWHAKRRNKIRLDGTHKRLGGFLAKATQEPKFRRIQAQLTVTLVKHHELASTLENRFGFANVVLAKPF